MLVNCLVDHHDYKRDIQHKYFDNEYEQNRKELLNYPKKLDEENLEVS